MNKSEGKFPLEKVIQGLSVKGKDFFLRNKRKVFIFAIVVFLYFFVIVIYQVCSQLPQAHEEKEQISELYLLEYINGWRDYQQNFDVEDMQFGEKFLFFTLNIRFQAKSILIVKKLAIDMALGLKEEYPELETISIMVVKDSGTESKTVYGRAVLSGVENRVAWKYQ
ncbi:MAG: hypothetical protein L6416_04380 [Candidatus Omnitrophica bacterium]|nr:hypothetical protein [Candidatus Omnitrophota bacterium]